MNDRRIQTAKSAVIAMLHCMQHDQIAEMILEQTGELLRLEHNADNFNDELHKVQTFLNDALRFCGRKETTGSAMDAVRLVISALIEEHRANLLSQAERSGDELLPPEEMPF